MDKGEVICGFFFLRREGAKGFSACLVGSEKCIRNGVVGDD